MEQIQKNTKCLIHIQVLDYLFKSHLHERKVYFLLNFTGFLEN